MHRTGMFDMSLLSYNVSEKISFEIHNAVEDIAIPLKKGYVFLPVEVFSEVKRRLNRIPNIENLLKVINEHLLSPFNGTQKGEGYLIIDGLFPDSLYPKGINPNKYSSLDFAPFDSKNFRAFDFYVELLENPLKVYVALACLVGIPFRMYESKTLIMPVTSRFHPKIDQAKFGGMGENLLHKDGGFLIPHPSNVIDEYSLGTGTEMLAFLSIIPDKFGSGVNWVLTENVDELMKIFTIEELNLLKLPIYFNLPSYDLNDTKGLNKFPIFYRDFTGNWRLRFSGKLRSYMVKNWYNDDPVYAQIDGEKILNLLDRIDFYLSNHPNRKEILLKTGQIIFLNQFVTMHGRSKVRDSNRLLAELFIRIPHINGSKNALRYISQSVHK